MALKKATRSQKQTQGRWLDVDEIRLVADLRIMHSKVDELYQVVTNLKRRHTESDIMNYADQPLLNEDIARMDHIYLWFVRLKDERKSRAG